MCGFYKDLFKVLMDIYRMLNSTPGSSGPNPSGNGSPNPGNGSPGPKPMPASTSKNPNDEKARRPNSSGDRDTSEPIDSQGEYSVPSILSMDFGMARRRLEGLKQALLDERAARNIKSKTVTLGDIGIFRGATANRRNNTDYNLAEFLQTQIFSDENLRTQIWGNKTFSGVNVEKVIQELQRRNSS